MKYIVLLAAILASVAADTPANCSYEDVRGSWVFQETARTGNSGENCDSLGPIVYQLELNLLFPDVAVDQFGNEGHWTLIYNQGFEVRINQRKYFAFSYYEQSGDNVTSYCDTTFNGWSHDVLVRNWGCYTAKKVAQVPAKYHQVESSEPLKGRSRNQAKLVDAINKAQKSWTAKVYPKFQDMSEEDMLNMRGGRKSRIYSPPSPAPVTPDVRRRAAELPAAFDWRNVSGVNYVTPVRDQASCGSCYAFSATAMVEARLRVLTNNTVDIVLSPQDVVSCSEYAQGCAGGFPYLIGGKYAQDFGFVEESCNPYLGQDGPCNEAADCVRHYVSKYQYIGGFYGGCNEELMKESLLKGGPLSVSFEVYDDFDSYSGGIYHHVDVTTELSESEFNPFEITNHAVLLVGYGADETTGEKFWTIKNSWGADWGENGYFRIRRGTDECSIESLAVEVLPIP